MNLSDQLRDLIPQILGSIPTFSGLCRMRRVCRRWRDLVDRVVCQHIPYGCGLQDMYTEQFDMWPGVVRMIVRSNHYGCILDVNEQEFEIVDRRDGVSIHLDNRLSSGPGRLVVTPVKIETAYQRFVSRDIRVPLLRVMCACVHGQTGFVESANKS